MFNDIPDTLTNQEAFDRVVNHLRMQGVKALKSDTGICQYRGENGTACAAGCLIRDDEYNELFEGGSVESLTNEDNRFGKLTPESLRNRFAPIQNVLYRLQQAHDNYAVREWENEFQRIATREGLTYTPPELDKVGPKYREILEAVANGTA